MSDIFMYFTIILPVVIVILKQLFNISVAASLIIGVLIWLWWMR